MNERRPHWAPLSGLTDDSASKWSQKNKHGGPGKLTSNTGNRQKEDLCISHQQSSQFHHPNTRKTMFSGALNKPARKCFITLQIQRNLTSWTGTPPLSIFPWMKNIWKQQPRSWLRLPVSHGEVSEERRWVMECWTSVQAERGYTHIALSLCHLWRHTFISRSVPAVVPISVCGRTHS